MDTVPTCNDDNEPLQSRPESGNDTVPVKSPQTPFRAWPQQAEDKDVKRRSSSAKLSKEKYYTRLESDSEDYKQSAHMRHLHYRSDRDSVPDTDFSVDPHIKTGAIATKSSRLSTCK